MLKYSLKDQQVYKKATDINWHSSIFVMKLRNLRAHSSHFLWQNDWEKRQLSYGFIVSDAYVVYSLLCCNIFLSFLSGTIFYPCTHLDIKHGSWLCVPHVCYTYRMLENIREILNSTDIELNRNDIPWSADTVLLIKSQKHMFNFSRNALSMKALQFLLVLNL